MHITQIEQQLNFTEALTGRTAERQTLIDQIERLFGSPELDLRTGQTFERIEFNNRLSEAA